MEINFYYLDEKGERKHDLHIPIFELSISQKEGEVALAKLLVPTSYAFAGVCQKALIVQTHQGTDKPLFLGTQVSFPRTVQKDVCEIELSAAPIDAYQQVTKLAENLKEILPYNPLFFDQNDLSVSNCLETTPQLFHWDRVRGTVGVSSIFNGASVLDLSDHVFEGVKMRLADMPYDAVHVNVHAQWTQRYEGEFDAFPFIAREFPKGKVNTLTPQFLMHHWPKVGDYVGRTGTRKRSGYQVVHRQLACVQPPPTGGLNIYPTLTPEVLPGKRLQRYWMEGALLLACHYVQKRQETVSFSVSHRHQLQGGMGRIKTLNLHLQKVEAGNTFFATDTGHKAITYANLMAQTILANSARCVEVEFQVPLSAGVDLTLDHSVRLRLPMIPGGELVGKVVAYKFIKTFQQEICWIRLAVSAGLGTERAAELKELPKSDLTEKPLEDYTSEDFVKSVSIQWDAEQQIALLSQDHMDTESFQTALNACGTTITLTLADLRTKDTVAKTINLGTTEPFQAPQHIQLRGDI